MISILYLAHNLNDPAIHRRVMMLQAGGALVHIAGFRRSREKVETICGAKAINLGVTSNGKFLDRLLKVCIASFSLRRQLEKNNTPDVILARNLEMLVLGFLIRPRKERRDSPFIYECLDIHRFMLRTDVIGTLMRKAENFFGRRARLLITSSPAFVDNYFGPTSELEIPILLVENKFLDLQSLSSKVAQNRQDTSPHKAITLGWFGILRCKRSFELLAEFSRRMNGRFEIVLRGQPALDVLPDFYEHVEDEPYMTFHGAYSYPDDLADIYASVDMVWAIDFFEAGQNSDWLLPNRLYEGCLFGAVPLFMERTEVARYCRTRKIGIGLSQPDVQTFMDALSCCDRTHISEMQNVLMSVNRQDFRCGPDDCNTLVRQLESLTERSRSYNAETIADDGKEAV